MVDDWIELPFSEAVLLNPPTPLKRGAIYPFVDMAAVMAGARDVTCSEQREFNGSGSRFQDRDTLMARITPCLENGKLARFRAPIDQRVGHGSTEFIVVRGKPEVTDNDFAYYLTISPEIRSFAISQMTGSSGRQRVPTDSLGGISVLIPSLKEQRKIVTVLSDLDDKIAVNERMNTTLEAMTHALFQSWFVDFDPVRAKLDSRKPFYTTQAIANLFPDKFSHFKNQVIPYGWLFTTIDDVCGINTKTLSKSDPLTSLEYVEISEVSLGNISSISKYERGEEPSRARRKLSHGDTVLSTVRPDRGSYFLSLDPPSNRVASTGFAVISPAKVPWSYIYVALTQPEIFYHLGQMADGGAYPAVRPEVIGSIKIILPENKTLLTEFHNICAPLLEKAEANRIQSRSLAALRDTLLPKLLSGALSVENLLP